MVNNYFKVLRGGTHTTFQDNGFINKQYLGITSGGAVDNELFILSNKILNNSINIPALEFCLQGPSLELINGNARIIITGNVLFNIITPKKIYQGIPFKSYLLKKGDIVDILSTVNSNYGYLSIQGGFKINKEFESFSTLTVSKIGSNKGCKILDNQIIFYNKNGSSKSSKNNFIFKKLSNFIHVIPGPQMNYFFPRIIKKFFNVPFVVSNASNRMGIRLNGNICKPIKSQNIVSEGIVNGSVQIPGDGNPIVLMNDRPTIGGYPKIATVILADISKLSQLPIGTQFNFKRISIKDAECLFKNKIKKFDNQLEQISKK